MLAALLLAAAAPEPAPPVWQGVWQGRIGTLPVRACLGRRGDGSSVGAYYYLSRLRPIRLGQQEASRVWLEGADVPGNAVRPRWSFATVEREALAGVWSDGRRRLPFRLGRIAAAAGDEPCGSAAFNNPRTAPFRITAVPRTIDGLAYRALRFDAGAAFESVELESFALSGEGPAVRRINARLRKRIPDTATQGEWYACVTGGLAMQGVEGEYSEAVAPTMATTRWLAASETVGGYCGGAHPSVATNSLTFDRATGAELDLHDWLGDAAVARDAYGATLKPALRAAILARADGYEAECREAAATEAYWDIGLSRAGLVFTPQMPHALTPCEEPVTMPWAIMSRWLGAAGRAGAASFGPAKPSPAPARR